MTHNSKRAFRDTVSCILVRWHMPTVQVAISEIDAAHQAAIEAAYKRGWNDREGDLLAGVDRIYGPSDTEAAIEAAEKRGYGRAANIYMLTGEAERIRASNKALLERIIGDTLEPRTDVTLAVQARRALNNAEYELAAIEQEEADGHK